MTTSSSGSASAGTTATGSTGRQFVGLVLLLGGFFLAVVGFTLPWVDVTCSANCVDAPLLGTRSPLAFVAFWPLWLLASIAAFATAWQEGLPTGRRSAVPALLLAGLLLLAQALTLLVLSVFFPHPATPILITSVTPLSAVSPLGAVLVAVGGWLRYHPRRSDSSLELAYIPAEQ